MKAAPSVALTIALTVAGAALVLAGPLSPPAGPVAATYKTLAEVEPRIAINSVNTPGDAASVYKITQAGSYYMTGNISGAAGKATILINAHSVSIDMSGFAILGGQTGIANLPPPGSGVVTNISISNGRIHSCVGGGIKLNTSFNTHIEGIQVQGCGEAGIQVHWDSVVRDCVAQFCNPGFIAGSDVAFTECSAMDSGGDGFVFDDGCVLDRCIVSTAGGHGFYGVDRNTLVGCTADLASGDGVRVGSGCLIERSRIVRSGGIGILAVREATIRECVVNSGNVDGVSVGDHCSIIGNTIHRNAYNVGTGTGLRVTGDDGVVQGNRVSANGNWGIYVSGTGNLITGNWSRGHANTNFYAAAGNDSGQVVNAPGVGFANGNPWANFTR